MGFLSAMLGGKRERVALVPLYRAIVDEARRSAWFLEAEVPDTIDGRFDVLALVLSLVLLRLEREGEVAERASVLLTEVFIDDMDGTMREIGHGDLVVGKRVGGIMGALGGRLGAYRSGDRRAALVRNLFRDAPPSDAAVDRAVAMSMALETRITGVALDRLLAGALA
ncbi:MAG: ubiquinol-cytochrome C chaperone family protein [Sphingomonadaceae bacterium]